MSILEYKTDRRAIQIVARSLKILDEMPSNIHMTNVDDFELSLAKNMLKSVIEDNEQLVPNKPT